MATGNEEKILEYLKKQGSANTFRLARELAIERRNLLSIIHKLEEQGAVEFKSGKAAFLKFPKTEKKEELKWLLKPQKMPKKRKIIPNLQEENKKLKEKLEELKKTISALEQKASAPPKVVTRTIIKKIPKIITKTIIKKVPIEAKKKAKRKKLKAPKQEKWWKLKTKNAAQRMSGVYQKVKRLKNVKQKIKMPKLKLPKLKLPTFKKKRS